MGKAPAFQFYVRDWLSDPELQATSSSTRGVWINCLCFMWESAERGRLSGKKDSLARLLNATAKDFDGFLKEASVTNFADVTVSNGNVTIENRRMKTEAKSRQNTRLRVQRHRAKRESNVDVTVTSSSSSSSSKNKDYTKGFLAFWGKYPRKLKKYQAYQAWKRHTKTVELKTILKALSVQISSDDWQRDGGKYIPHPTSWINSRRWEDETDTPATSEPPGEYKPFRHKGERYEPSKEETTALKSKIRKIGAA